MKREEGIKIDGAYDPLLGAKYSGSAGEVEWWEEKEFTGQYLEQLGFKPKSRPLRTITAEDKRAVRLAVIDLRRGTTQMPFRSTNLGYYLSHYILADRFNPSESIHILSRVVAEQKEDLPDNVTPTALVLLNEQEEGNDEIPDHLGDTEFTFEMGDMSPEEQEMAHELMNMITV
jgi:hypothetical protein